MHLLYIVGNSSSKPYYESAVLLGAWWNLPPRRVVLAPPPPKSSVPQFPKTQQWMDPQKNMGEQGTLMLGPWEDFCYYQFLDLNTANVKCNPCPKINRWVSKPTSFGQYFRTHTVDGSEIRRSPVEVGSFFRIFKGFMHPKGSNHQQCEKNLGVGRFFFCIDFGGPNHQEVLEASKAMQGQPIPQPLRVPHVDPILIETLVEPGNLEGMRLQLPQGEYLDPWSNPVEWSTRKNGKGILHRRNGWWQYKDLPVKARG